ncbi:type II toxin-antitoxin system Phd/YefM family antitoxin [Devosia naphthalenivorans]|uniref:type II toxin-antitoxin system Phd/YefM family antitoxin n=1 Tax=Devosia naphthalenivorans TaxID=2082392 RepID=UPI000D383D7D|nr:type II toxin-antitoxin system Phd/YefM family antitoxin [Devosia naphthalenivorans]
MYVVNIHEAKTHLSRLIEKVAAGESFIIAKAGKPMAKVMPIDTVHKEQRRVGFLQGEFKVPDDFDRMGDKEIESFFGAAE